MDSLKATKRDVVGRKVSKLRSQGFVPANIYGKKVKSLAITLDVKEFLKTFRSSGETGLIEVNIGNDKRPVLVHNVQFHPVTEDVLHVDLLQVDLKEKVTAQVPVEVTGESPVEKQGAGTVVQYINEVEVKSLPADIPEKFEIDASDLKEVGQAVQVKDLKFDSSKVEMDLDPEEIVVKVEPPKKVEEEIPAPVVSEEGAPPEGSTDAGSVGENAQGSESSEEKSDSK